MVRKMIKVEIQKWYTQNEFYSDSEMDFDLPFEKNWVELEKNHAFLQVPLVTGYIGSIDRNGTEVVVSVEKRHGMYRSGLFRIYEWSWSDNRLRWKFDSIFALQGFKVKGEFSEEILIEREKKRKRHKQFGL